MKQKVAWIVTDPVRQNMDFLFNKEVGLVSLESMLKFSY